MQVQASEGDGLFARWCDWFADKCVERPRILMTIGLLIPVILSVGEFLLPLALTLIYALAYKFF